MLGAAPVKTVRLLAFGPPVPGTGGVRTDLEPTT